MKSSLLLQLPGYTTVSSCRLLFASPLASISHLIRLFVGKIAFQFDVKISLFEWLLVPGRGDLHNYMVCPLGFEVSGHVCKLLGSHFLKLGDFNVCITLPNPIGRRRLPRMDTHFDPSLPISQAESSVELSVAI